MNEKNKAEIQKRLPDAMEFSVSLLSPQFDFETNQGAQATFSLGSLMIRSTEPVCNGL